MDSRGAGTQDAKIKQSIPDVLRLNLKKKKCVSFTTPLLTAVAFFLLPRSIQRNKTFLTDE